MLRLPWIQTAHTKQMLWPAHIAPTCPWASDASPSPSQKIKSYYDNIWCLTLPSTVARVLSLFMKELYLALYLGSFREDTWSCPNQTEKHIYITCVWWFVAFIVAHGHVWDEAMTTCQTVHNISGLCIYTRGIKGPKLWWPCFTQYTVNHSWRRNKGTSKPLGWDKENKALLSWERGHNPLSNTLVSTYIP